MSDKTLRARRIANELVEQSMEQYRRQRAGEPEPKPAVQRPVVHQEKRFEPGQGFHTVFNSIIRGKDDEADPKDRKIHFLPPKEAYKKVGPPQPENISPVNVEAKAPIPSQAPAHTSVFETLSNQNTVKEPQQPKEAVLEDIEKPAETENSEAKDKPKPRVDIFEKLSRSSSSN